MLFSRKTRYALMACTVLAQEYGKSPVSVSTIAESEGIPKRFLESILSKLRGRGVVKSVRGKDGGYCLTRHPKQIRIDDIILECENDIYMECLHPSGNLHCEFNKNLHECKLRQNFSKVYGQLFAVLHNTTLQSLMSSASFTMLVEEGRKTTDDSKSVS